MLRKFYSQEVYHLNKVFMCLLFPFALLFINEVHAQKKVSHQNLGWLGLNTTIEINKKWFFQNEIQIREFLDPLKRHQFFVRSHLHYKIAQSGYDVSAGICYFMQNPNDPDALFRLSIPEWRPHLEFANKSSYNKLILESRYRAEARFFHQTNREKTELVDGYRFSNFRFRYRLQTTVPILKLDKNNAIKFKLGDEVMLNLGSKININVFDQNRFYFSIGCNVYRDISLDIGYLNWFQELSDGTFINRDIMQVAIFHKLSFKKRKD